MKQIGVGILGFGTVGAGVADGLLKHRDVMAKRLGVDIVLKKIADLDITTDRGISVPEGVLTTDAGSVLADPEVDIIVETIGGTGIAKTFVLTALGNGKCVVTANKKLLAEYGREIFETAAKNDVDIYFGASVGGGIPIIRVLREGLAGNEIESIHGILNGTCNYILTRMENEGLPFDNVLKDAQKLGYAEANPSLDIDGFDTAHKACILAALAYGFQPTLDQVQVEGIRNLAGADVKYAADFGYRIKLLAVVAKEGDEVEVGVHPTLIPFSHMLANVNDAFNAAYVKGDMSDYTMYYGRGAGRRHRRHRAQPRLRRDALRARRAELRGGQGAPPRGGRHQVEVLPKVHARGPSGCDGSRRLGARQARRFHLRAVAEGVVRGQPPRSRRRDDARRQGVRHRRRARGDQGRRRHGRGPGQAQSPLRSPPPHYNLPTTIYRLSR